MSYPTYHTEVVTTAADGSASVNTLALHGRCIKVIYVKGDYASGVDFSITTNETSQTLWAEDDVNASTFRCPRDPTHGSDGSASLYAAAGEPVEDHIRICQESVVIVITDGGDTKTGSFTFILE